MDIDNLIDGYPILLKLREISISIGHPVSCLIEMSILLIFAYLIYRIKKIKNISTYELLDGKNNEKPKQQNKRG